MFNKLFLVPLIFCGTIFFSSCKRNYIVLDFTNAKGEVPQTGNLVFRFNKSVYPDSLLNKWDSTGYISFKPAIPGRFRWSGPDELIFSPAEPLLPATSYEARISNEVLRFSSFTDIKDAGEIEFSTSPLLLNSLPCAEHCNTSPDACNSAPWCVHFIHNAEYSCSFIR